MFDADVDALDRRIGEWQAKLEDRARRAADLAARVRGLKVDASVAQGLITVTVDEGGHLSDLTLDERVRQWPADRIAQGVLAAVEAARSALGGHLRELTAESGFAGADS